MPHHVSHLIVVGTHKGGVFPRVSLTLEHDDGDALVEGTVDSRGNGCHLVRSHYQQIDATGHQRVNLLYLALIAIVGSSKAKLHTVLKVGTHAKLGILLLTPDVCRTL